MRLSAEYRYLEADRPHPPKFRSRPRRITSWTEPAEIETVRSTPRPQPLMSRLHHPDQTHSATMSAQTANPLHRNTGLFLGHRQRRTGAIPTEYAAPAPPQRFPPRHSAYRAP